MRYRKLISLIPLFCILLTAPLSYSAEIDDIHAAIRAKGAKWVAKENPISMLPQEERRKRVGTVEVGLTPDRVASEVSYAPPSVPLTYDWRNVSGSNFVTPIRNQGNCGSCWAFAVTAALESKALIAFNLPGTDLNLSEQIVVSCSGAGSCSGGSPSTASNFLVNNGTNLESCYPYTATNGDCNAACSNWENGAYRIDGWNYISSWAAPTVSAIKNAIYTNGPVIAIFDVYDDFFSYHSGVYSYVSGNYAGGHAVLIVGWDDGVSAFIVKNSWGASWGDSGYFMIAYSELTGTTNFASWSYAYGNVYQAIVEDIPPETTISAGPNGVVFSNDATFTFTFTGSDNVTPVVSLVYATYLQGYDSGWSSFSSSTTKSYNNLAPGSYTFQVKAKDQAGNEDPTPATSSFTVNYLSGRISYKINPNASYSYINGSNKVTSWQGDANDGYFDLSLGDFDFRFHGISVKKVRISTNGYITFEPGGTKSLNDPVPNAASPNALIAPFWDDLDLSGLSGKRGFRWALLGTAPNRQLVLEWNQVPSYDYRTETYSFEIILYESIDRIKFQYLDVDSGTNHDRGASATAGIENFAGTQGAEFSYNTPSLSNGLAIEFIPKPFEIVDFDEDEKTDILWRNTSTGDHAIWFMDGVTMTGVDYPPPLPNTASQIVGVGDFNDDTNPDILWRDTSTGRNYVWFMNGATFIGWAELPPLPNTALQIVGVGDFNNDTSPDILWRDTSTGSNYVWFMDGATFIGWAELPPLPNTALQIVGVGDFNDDTSPDILWRDTSTGRNYVWFMDGATFIGWAELPPLPDQTWTIVGVGDFNGDGNPDILWRNSSTGENAVWFMDGVTYTGYAYLPTVTDQNWKIVGP